MPDSRPDGARHATLRTLADAFEQQVAGTIRNAQHAMDQPEVKAGDPATLSKATVVWRANWTRWHVSSRMKCSKAGQEAHLLACAFDAIDREAAGTSNAARTITGHARKANQNVALS